MYFGSYNSNFDYLILIFCLKLGHYFAIEEFFFLFFSLKYKSAPSKSKSIKFTSTFKRFYTLSTKRTVNKMQSPDQSLSVIKLITLSNIGVI